MAFRRDRVAGLRSDTDGKLQNSARWQHSRVGSRGEQAGDGISLEFTRHYYLRDVDRKGIDTFAAYLDRNIGGDPDIIRDEV